MAAINIKTGGITSARGIPESRWRGVVADWTRISAMGFPEDCRSLLQMREECRDLGMWQVLGYESEDEFFRKELHLNPEAVTYACRALEVYDPDVPIGLSQAEEIGRLTEQGMTQQAIAKKLHMSQMQVSRTLNPKGLSSQNRNIRQFGWMPVKPEDAAAKIREKFGNEFANQLRNKL